MSLEILKNSLHDLSLHFWRDLLIEIELFNDQVEVVHECIMHILLNIAVKIRGDIVWFIRPFYLFDPNVEQTQLFIDKTLEVV